MSLSSNSPMSHSKNRDDKKSGSKKGNIKKQEKVVSIEGLPTSITPIKTPAL